MSEVRSDEEYQSQVKQMLQEQRYAGDQTSLIAALEAYAEHQFSHPSSYDLECNMHLLKAYQLEPNATKVELVVGILAKALTRLPSTDFQMSSFVLTEAVQLAPPVAGIIDLGNQLECANFAEFWKNVAQQRSVLDKIADFDQAIRQFIFYVVVSSYKVISKDLLSEFVNLPVTALNEIAQQKNWTTSVDAYTIPTSEATELATAPIENIQLSQLFPILAHLK